MKMKANVVFWSAVSVVALFSAGAAAQADSEVENAAEQADTYKLKPVVVTAEKREATANSVPMSISTIDSEQLFEQGIDTVGDLAKVIPGFQSTHSYRSTPVYTLRGIGFYDNALGARPTVAIYTDETPLPFAVMTSGVTLDLERIEVLKGPQGILFGQNSTAGAINYIAAKPGDHVEFGVSASYGSFGQGKAEGFVSGPVADGVGVRIAVQQQYGGDWQESYTRDDSLGERNVTSGRVIVDLEPSDNFNLSFTLSGWQDKSDGVAGQLISVTPQNAAALPPGLISYPLPPSEDARAADWSEGVDYRRDSSFYQVGVRGDWDISDNATLTSITSYASLDELKPQIEMDATSYNNQSFFVSGDLSNFSQELRLAGEVGENFRYIAGLNYAKDEVDEDDTFAIEVNSANGTFVPFGLGSFVGLGFYTHAEYETSAAFANVDVDLTDALTVHAGVRYTEFEGKAKSCTFDTDGVFGPGLEILYSSILGSIGAPPVSIPAGGCGNADEFLQPGEASNDLSEDNISYRLGVDLTPTDWALLYANVSRGYKAGSFPTLPANSNGQFEPATQEEVVAYEAGFKLTLFDQTMQLNGAAFYYDYSDKQIAGRVLTSPNIFGPLETLVNVPESHVAGAELQVDWVPAPGLTLMAAGTYIDSEVDGEFYNYDYFGQFQLMSGQSFPYTPEWQGVIDAKYEWSVSEKFDAFVGGGLRSQSGTRSSLGQLDALNQQLYLDGYTLIDLRAGLSSPDNHWRVSIFGRNVTDEYYRINAVHSSDTNYAFAGQPATYGISLSYRN